MCAFENQQCRAVLMTPCRGIILELIASNEQRRVRARRPRWKFTERLYPRQGKKPPRPAAG